MLHDIFSGLAGPWLLLAACSRRSLGRPRVAPGECSWKCSMADCVVNDLGIESKKKIVHSIRSARCLPIHGMNILIINSCRMAIRSEELWCFVPTISEALQDFDILEDGFHRLQNARVLAADYDLLRQHLGFQGEDWWAFPRPAEVSDG